MHLDWSTLSLSGYFEALEAHNSASSGDSKEVDHERLSRFVEAHRGKVGVDRG